jgi:hypothetical protein
MLFGGFHGTSLSFQGFLGVLHHVEKATTSKRLREPIFFLLRAINNDISALAA